MSRLRQSTAFALTLGVSSFGRVVVAQEPDHPIITEVFYNPTGLNDGPRGRDPSNQHQEFIEIYLPTASDLAVGLDKDALNLAFYEVEGDLTSSGYMLVNYRIDLPTFDLDSGNGVTSGAVERPANGIVVIGWVDYLNHDAGTCAGDASTCGVFAQDCADLTECIADAPAALEGTVCTGAAEHACRPDRRRRHVDDGLPVRSHQRGTVRGNHELSGSSGDLIHQHALRSLQRDYPTRGGCLSPRESR